MILLLFPNKKITNDSDTLNMYCSFAQRFFPTHFKLLSTITIIME